MCKLSSRLLLHLNSHFGGLNGYQGEALVTPERARQRLEELEDPDEADKFQKELVGSTVQHCP